ncbi:phosphoglucosamine mutase [Anaeromyxobacter diazotrophicus]|uniref:Phosphoglucosamine mutase n=1 Tax=Anaeromyxobacter diazotrophicus TaxID=2590199 RepID=A0A7I9VL81_9BACT|nr:phosphoglucosamine mutase [Anaeromyxobacter diazotrophicus]GEJ57176.1 phosphoglucosamine mutase [Anaeromyxobacter diazotrophicus]
MNEKALSRPPSGGAPEAAAARRLFGTDGVRGVANVYPMTAEMALQLGRALAYLVRSGPHRHRIVIGKDTRLSGYLLEQAIASGICSMGVDVMLCGPLPTPGIAFITESMRADAGVVISASHNPYQDNGIKFFSRDGYKLPDEMELRIERLVLGTPGDGNGSDDFHALRPTANRIGKAKRIDDAGGRYIVFLKSLFPRELTLDGLTVVVDCGHGAAYKVAPAVFEELGAKVVRLGVKPDGKNINDACGAVHPEAMAKAVEKHGAQLGIALDGDADRVIVSDEHGHIVDGDAIMAIVGRDMVRARTLAKKTVVATVMSNVGLERSLREVGGRVVRTAVGDRYVVEEMRRSGYNFGGEQSGHLLFLDHVTTGDGVCAALNLLAVMLREQRPVSELARCFEPVPQVQLNVPVREKRPLEQLPEVQKAVAAVEKALAGDGRVLVRYSGTENKARVLVEGPDAKVIAAHAEGIAGALRRALA